jgi:hypothetical protein
MQLYLMRRKSVEPVTNGWMQRGLRSRLNHLLNPPQLFWLVSVKRMLSLKHNG